MEENKKAEEAKAEEAKAEETKTEEVKAEVEAQKPAEEKAEDKEPKAESTEDAAPAQKSEEAPGKKDRAPKGKRGQRRKREEVKKEAPVSDWKERVVQIRRVTKVVKGGKKLSFRATVVVGNGKGEVGLGIGKSSEVIGAIQKAIADGRKNTVKVPIFNTTIPHKIISRAGSGSVVLKPASKGTGIIAGGSVRAVLELAGIENILSKSLGSDSPLNSARATIQALSELRSFKDVAAKRGMTVKEILS